MSRPKIKTYREGDVYRYAHLKRDGIWITLKHDIGGIRTITRRPTDITLQLVYHPTVQAFRDSSQIGDALYCELFAPGEPASIVKSYLADGLLDRLRLEAFATPDLPIDMTLGSVEVYAKDRGVPFAKYHWLPDYDGPLDLDWGEEAAEGTVYKDGNLLNWAKLKPELTADLVVIGYTEGEGKFSGLIGALCLGFANGDHVCKCSGMTDDVRRAISADRDGHLGRVTEVRYQYVASQGGLRHPRFVMFRDDKRAEECVGL